MQFDIFTTLAASCTVIFLLGLIFAYFWIRRRQNVWYGWWATGYLLLGLGNILVMTKDDVPDIVNSALANAILIFGFGVIWQAVRVFEGRRPLALPLVAVVAAWLVLFFVPDIRSAQWLRIVITSIAMAGFLFLGAVESWRGRAELLPSRTALVILFIVAGFVFAGRVPLAQYAPYPIGAQPVDPVVVTGFNFVLIVLSISATVLLISLTQERMERGQRQLAATDQLTGLLNRRGLDQIFADNELPAGAALIVFDLDRFKSVNDTFGHAAGDRLLASFGQLCREHARQVDYAVRYGGEEFMLILPRTDLTAAMDVAEHIRVAFSEMVVAIETGAIVGTVSGGVFAAPPDQSIWLATAVAEADAALYDAKEAGRNRVFAHTPINLSIDDGSRSFDERCVAPDGQAASA